MKATQRLTNLGSRKFLISNLGVVLAAVAPFVFRDEIEPKHSLIAITTLICVYILANVAMYITDQLTAKD